MLLKSRNEAAWQEVTMLLDDRLLMLRLWLHFSTFQHLQQLLIHHTKGLPHNMATTTEVATRTAPSQSLYIQNLPEKLQKHDLKRNLYMLFTTYGPVLDITAVKSSKMRGQAHVLFRDTNTATQAMRHTQGMDFFGREMVSLSMLLKGEGHEC